MSEADREELRLIEPTEELGEEYVAYLEEFVEAGEAHLARGLDEARSDLPGYVRALRDAAAGVGLRPGLVPWNEYWLVRDRRIVGSSNLRHRLTPALRVEGGHIGYRVRPGERRKGYGKRLLALTLKKARERDLERVMVTCDKDNVASARIIEANGGRLAGEGASPRTGKRVLRYWIEREEDGR
jgi:predicted acetyltransferase